MMWWGALMLVGVDAAPVPSWRQVATEQDRVRLRGWRDGWRHALAAVRPGEDAARVATDRALYDPDGALDRPAIAAGIYRCRTIRFATSGLLTPEAAPCRIVEGHGGERLEVADAALRFDGTIYPDGSRRAIFLGTQAYPGERRASPYGRAAGRDMIGIVERIGDRRWRLVMPAPHFGSQFDVVVIEPAD